MTVGTWEKLEDNGNGRIVITVGDKTVPLRYTVYQMERLNSLTEEVKKADKKDVTISEIAARDLDLCEIALNPMPDKVDFTRKEISELLDLDQIKILGAYWLAKKVYTPVMDEPPKKNQK